MKVKKLKLLSSQFSVANVKQMPKNESEKKSEKLEIVDQSFQTFSTMFDCRFAVEMMTEKSCRLSLRFSV